MKSESRIFYASRPKVLLLSFLGLGMTALSGAIPLAMYLKSQLWGVSLVMGSMGVFGFFFFGWATVVAFYLAMRRKPVIRVDAKGIHVWRYPTLAWDNYDLVGIGETAGQVFLSVQAKDTVAYQKHMNPFSRWWVGKSQTLIDGDIFVAANMLEYSVRDVAGEIADYAKKM